jgi:hypothetical protein
MANYCRAGIKSLRGTKINYNNKKKLIFYSIKYIEVLTPAFARGSRRRRVCLFLAFGGGNCFTSLLEVSQVTLFRSGSAPNNNCQLVYLFTF